MAPSRETVYVLLGTDRDPMPEEPKRTRYWIAAGPCPRCGHTQRRLLRDDADLIVRCTGCGERTVVGLDAQAMAEASYVFWCSDPRFESDDVPLSRQERDEIERLLAEFAPEVEPAYFGVVIEAGICRRTSDCINVDCPYNHRSLDADSR